MPYLRSVSLSWMSDESIKALAQVFSADALPRLHSLTLSSRTDGGKPTLILGSAFLLFTAALAEGAGSTLQDLNCRFILINGNALGALAWMLSSTGCPLLRTLHLLACSAVEWKSCGRCVASESQGTAHQDHEVTHITARKQRKSMKREKRPALEYQKMESARNCMRGKLHSKQSESLKCRCCCCSCYGSKIAAGVLFLYIEGITLCVCLHFESHQWKICP